MRLRAGGGHKPDATSSGTVRYFKPRDSSLDVIHLEYPRHWENRSLGGGLLASSKRKYPAPALELFIEIDEVEGRRIVEASAPQARALMLAAHPKPEQAMATDDACDARARVEGESIEFRPRLWRRLLLAGPWAALQLLFWSFWFGTLVVAPEDGPWSLLARMSWRDCLVAVLCALVVGLGYTALAHRGAGIRVTETTVERRYRDGPLLKAAESVMPLDDLDRSWSGRRERMARILGYQILTSTRADGIKLWLWTFSPLDLERLRGRLCIDESASSHANYVEFRRPLGRWLVSVIAWQLVLPLLIAGSMVLLLVLRPGSEAGTRQSLYWFLLTMAALFLVLSSVRLFLSCRDSYLRYAARTSIRITDDEVSGLGRLRGDYQPGIVTIRLSDLDRPRSAARRPLDRVFGRQMLWSKWGSRVLVPRRMMAKDDVERLLVMLALT